MGGVRIMKVILSADHAGVTVRNEMKDLLTEMNIDYVDTGCEGSGSVDYPDFALPAAERVANGEFDRGILICGTGIRSEEHTSELQSRGHLVCRLLLEKKNKK